jgi:hypothetical protein
MQGFDMNARHAQIGHARILLRLGGFGLLTGLLQLQGGCVYEPSPQPPASDQAAATYEPPPAPVITEYQQDLTPYGSWVMVADYGQCWCPASQPDGWQPYTVGHWEYSDVGWTWVAEGDEAQWGSICYHYGRWYRDNNAGWVWIPGDTWAPAWVAWREGNGYCGWAPLPPQAGFGPDVSVAVVDQYVPPQQYVYCSEQYVNASRVDQHFVRNDTTIINQTTNITNITVVNNVVVNRGITVDNVERATGRPVEKVAIANASTPQEARTLAAAGKPVAFRPPAVQQAAGRTENQPARQEQHLQAATSAPPPPQRPEYHAPPRPETPPAPQPPPRENPKPIQQQPNESTGEHEPQHAPAAPQKPQPPPPKPQPAQQPPPQTPKTASPPPAKKPPAAPAKPPAQKGDDKPAPPQDANQPQH